MDLKLPNKLLSYLPPRDPVIYILYVLRESKWVVYYVGETIKSIRRLYDHAKDPKKEEWAKCGCKYRLLKAPKDVKKRTYYEAYLVTKLQPVCPTQSGMYLRGYLLRCLSRRSEKNREITPGYGKTPLMSQNVGITVYSKMKKRYPAKVSELKSINPPVYYTQEDKNQTLYNRGKFSLKGISYDEWLVNPDKWGDRNKGIWPVNHKEIRKIYDLVQKERKDFEKKVIEKMKGEIKNISDKKSESEMIKIKSMLTQNTYIVPNTPSIKTKETILWEKAVEKQQEVLQSKKGITYEEALDKQRSQEIYRKYKNTSVNKTLNQAKVWLGVNSGGIEKA